ncbi:hypothetical protein ACGFNV_09215 [Streptomyces sp. NPDC048751]|uniref:hypothetical protein n=1 Tax=Streptomyces sp. NPDC048751 TaxID=3365591 RepID=UPI00371557D3
MERPDDRIASALRFASELVAWVATPWALSAYSWVLAVSAVVVPIRPWGPVEQPVSVRLIMNGEG